MRADAGGQRSRPDVRLKQWGCNQAGIWKTPERLAHLAKREVR